jgi:excisionase family DNA binding protein
MFVCSALVLFSLVIEKEKELMVQKQRPEETLLTVNDVAHRLRVNKTTVRSWIVAGALKAIVLPHAGQRQSYRIRPSTLDALLQTTLPD